MSYSSEPFDTGPDAPSLAAQMDARGWPHPPVVGGEVAARLLAAMGIAAAMPPNCPRPLVAAERPPGPRTLPGSIPRTGAEAVTRPDDARELVTELLEKIEDEADHPGHDPAWRPE